MQFLPPSLPPSLPHSLTHSLTPSLTHSSLPLSHPPTLPHSLTHSSLPHSLLPHSLTPPSLSPSPPPSLPSSRCYIPQWYIALGATIIPVALFLVVILLTFLHAAVFHSKWAEREGVYNYSFNRQGTCMFVVVAFVCCCLLFYGFVCIHCTALH